MTFRRSLKELVYGATCSMRTLPFFRRPGKWEKALALDGGFSSWFAIPEDAYFSHAKVLCQHTPSSLSSSLSSSSSSSSTPSSSPISCIPEIDHVLRVSVIHTSEADISPPEKFLWPWQDWCTSGTLEQNIERFQLGYIHASNITNLSMLVSKGLRWTFPVDHSAIDLNDWNTHIQQRITFHSQSLRDFFQKNTAT
ncbi:hypothetical protein RFI_07279 [Reticulomyxa filosa]|uniref:Uncharacterized protein n=1 Tax=Reticulomyxa filosa TaxID=46433 RepID=X6NU71_RETFI|nr:hypothetical protein RFI_07279 [Reticulomyxa filosa]|eukprot:ETO29840.1 hypothetical protein RFI_07279 [Reticulomyxa filosa]